jgi:hypothetical protein
MEQDNTTKGVSPNKNPATCCECGSPGVYSVDVFGIRSETYRCRDCHEQACRRNVRQDLWNKYGYKYADK